VPRPVIPTTGHSPRPRMAPPAAGEEDLLLPGGAACRPPGAGRPSTPPPRAAHPVSGGAGGGPREREATVRPGRCRGRPARTAHQRGEERRSGEAEEGARWGRSRGRGDDAGSRPTLLLPRLETIFGAVTERGGSSLGPSPTVVNDNRRGHHSVVPRRRQRDECRTKLPSPTCSGKFCRT